MKLIVWIQVFLLSFFATACSAQLSQDQIHALESLVESTFDHDSPGGAVLVAHKDEILYQAAIGTGGSEESTLTTDSIFRIASVTKQFTAVAILQLQEQGKLNLDDDITKYIREFETFDKHITIKMLLNHTSGVRDFTSMPEFNPALEATDVTPTQLMEFFNNQELDFEPSTHRSYSNSGYALLGIIIERISKMTYAEYMEKHIFSKIGMERSFAGGDHHGTTGFASGHYISETGYPPANTSSLTWPYAAGCIETTVADLHIWTQALFAGTIVSPDSLRMAHTVTTLPSGEHINYGFGWDLFQIQGHPTVEHGGAIAGFASTVIYIPDEELFVAVLCNAAWGGTSELAARLGAIAIDQPYPEISEFPIAPSALQEYTGIYTNPNGDERHININNDRLYSQRIGGMGLFLIPTAPDQFMMEGQLIDITFTRNRDDRVESLIFTSRSEQSIWDLKNAINP